MGPPDVHPTSTLCPTMQMQMQIQPTHTSIRSIRSASSAESAIPRGLASPMNEMDGWMDPSFDLERAAEAMADELLVHGVLAGAATRRSDLAETLVGSGVTVADVTALAGVLACYADGRGVGGMLYQRLRTVAESDDPSSCELLTEVLPDLRRRAELLARRRTAPGAGDRSLGPLSGGQDTFDEIDQQRLAQALLRDGRTVEDVVALTGVSIDVVVSAQQDLPTPDPVKPEPLGPTHKDGVTPGDGSCSCSACEAVRTLRGTE